MRRRDLLTGATVGLLAGTRESAAKFGAIFRGGTQSGAPPSGAYSVVVTMDAGPIYTYNPVTPDSHTTILNQANFVSDFAGFTQASVMCSRDDTALRVYFRQDVSPDPTRIEIILELGHFTTNGSAANLAGFTLQILQAGVPQPIPYGTSGNLAATSTSPHFPQMGWWTRWRWNPRPRPIVRNGAALVAANLVPSFSAALATAFRAADCGTAGSSSYIITNYSSAYASGSGNNLNPVGVNENCGTGVSMGGVGDLPQIGLATEWQANWIANGNANAQAAMLVLGDMAGGIPWCQRDSTTNWAPNNFITNGFIAYASGTDPPYQRIDTPAVPVPSLSGPQYWAPEVNHIPSYSFVPYLATGDPYHLENTQFYASWIVGWNGGHREVGFGINGLDPGDPGTPGGFNQAFPSWRAQSRGVAWAVRAFAECYIATPASAPSWLLPKQYFKDVLDLNASFANSWGQNYPTDHSGLTQYPALQFQGTKPAANQYEQGFFVSFLMLGLTFAVNQGGVASWAPYLNYAAAMPINWANGTSGWDDRFPVGQYVYLQQPISNDWVANPPAFANFTDVYNYHINGAMMGQNGAVWGMSPDGPVSIYPAWVAGTYHCNSWIVEVRSGCPVLPTAGDIISITITGSFAGSPVTIPHTITSGDITNLLTCVNNFGNSANPLSDALKNGINANSSLIAAGITAADFNQNSGPGSVITIGGPGRIYIKFNSDGTSSTGGPVIGPITVTGSFTTATNNTLYIQPNGDGAHKGNSGSNLLGRPISYACGKSGVSTSGPSGIALQTLVADNTTNWCFVPEYKSVPLMVPGGPTQAFPATGFGGVYGGLHVQSAYLPQAWCAMNPMVTAGIAGASGCLTNLRAAMNYRYNTLDTGLRNQFKFSIAPTPLPISITLTVVSANVPLTTPPGTVLATAGVTTSDGSPYGGTLSTSNTDLFAIQGLSIVSARAFTLGDVGPQTTTITANRQVAAVFTISPVRA